ncbi:MAG: ATP-dependent Clp protease ATP-binding subunit ClpC [Planctomycetota bacterium]|jgi:ATP-dependent Clp protease ATP-binding subunit ClpC
MQADTNLSYFRYFDLADAFVEVRQVGSDQLGLEAGSGLDRATYVDALLATCLPDLDGAPSRTLEVLFPDESNDAAEALYRLCIDVNPELAIERVQLRVSPVAAEPGPEADAVLLRALPDASGWMRRLPGLAERLSASVLGQETAIERVVDAMRRAAAGLAAGRRPIASFLLCGRTGTGKTELARALSRELFAEPQAHMPGHAESGRSGLIRIDCSELASAHETARLIGAPPGYVGHEAGGVLTERIAANPASVVLFDEVEKAHGHMRALLLQILEEGCLTDGRGLRVSFEDAVVVMTANSGAEGLQAASEAVGFERPGPLTTGVTESITRSALRSMMPPELLARIDQVLVFNDIDEGSRRAIAAKELRELAERALPLGVQLDVSRGTTRWLAERAGALDQGARAFRHLIQAEIEPMLAGHVLGASGSEVERVRLCIRRHKPVLRPSA